MRNIQILDEFNEFRKWLKGNSLSEKSISDCISRCRRVKKEFGVDLNQAVSSEESFLDLMSRIKQLAETSSGSKYSQYALVGALNAACRKYAHFKGRNYPITNYQKLRHGSTTAHEEGQGKEHYSRDKN